MDAPIGVPYGQELAELLAALRLFAGPFVHQVPGDTLVVVEELAVLRARQVGRFYLNACGLRGDNPRRPSPYNPPTFGVRVHAEEHTCGCGLYTHSSRRNPNAIHIEDCPYGARS